MWREQTIRWEQTVGRNQPEDGTYIAIRCIAKRTELGVDTFIFARVSTLKWPHQVQYEGAVLRDLRVVQPSMDSGRAGWGRHGENGICFSLSNYPISMLTRKMGPALAAGCTIVLKPAEATPLCAQAVYECLIDAGMPVGVINLVTALDPKPIGDVFTSDPRVKKLTFTGSTAVGRILASKAGHSLQRVSVELGGHAPFIVYPDADPVHAAKGAAALKFLNSGQACISPNRIFVHADHAEAFIDTIVPRVAKVKVGEGTLEGVGVGPLVNEAAVAKVANQVDDARAKGAEVPVGGKRLVEDGLDRGHFYAPTVVTGVTEDMLIYREETFGPVAPIITYDDVDQVIAMANDTNYGLAAYVYTRDLSTAIRAMEGLRFGIIGINDVNPASAGAPFGGMGDSGLGREGGHEGIGEYQETKLAGIAL